MIVVALAVSACSVLLTESEGVEAQPAPRAQATLAMETIKKKRLIV
jgi:hypothetical protein